MSILEKIAVLIIPITIILTAYGIPKEEYFKKMCNSVYQEQSAKELATMLENETKTQRLLWISKFDDNYNSPIVYAVNCKNIPIIKLLIEISLQDSVSYYRFTMKNGTSMLTLAASKNEYEIVKLLLDKEHPVSMDINLNSAIHESAKLGNIEICKLLLITDKGRQLLHTKNYQHKTPINYLIEHKQEEFIIQLLSLNSVNINNIPLDCAGMSYLHYAVIHKLRLVVRELLQQGFDPTQKSFSKMTPISLSDTFENIDIQKIILSHMQLKNKSQKKTIFSK